jgi:F-type H+/Na+-transporting ATPase subunit beta
VVEQVDFLKESNGAGENTGTVVSVRGSVIDVHFPRQLPSLYNRLLAGEENPVSIEVISHLNSQNVRGISLVPTQGLARGQRVLDTGHHFHVPVGERVL